MRALALVVVAGAFASGVVGDAGAMASTGASVLASPGAGAEVAAYARAITAQPRWHWPLPGRRVIARAFLAPPHAYGPGHRGIDLRADGASDEHLVVAPADGIVAFASTVVDRPLLTIDHGGGVVSTLEPVTASVTPGERVTRGAPVGVLSTGGHAAAGMLHLGVRVDGDYVNPLLFLGGLQRARLLPLG